MINTDKILDAKGLACPMPIVKTKQIMNELLPGEVLEVQATDKGSTADLKAWTERVGHQYIGTIDEGNSLKHYVRKASKSEEKKETTYKDIVSNDELLEQIQLNNKLVIVDVREEAEYTFNHIPGTLSIPIGELTNRLHELNGEDNIFLVCRTGNRSDLAAQLLVENGFKKVKNVVPGMSAWNGPMESGV
ncbi:sulfurtransferase TusA family protein [Evansella tamaricis]|uniref:Sulfurtransferase TusA family protein n=1 Tax=Evansella tamaricis TaxID=2069301 RepID=A0ABS6JKJ1_9BACI|nr:sulfurtransferase TusA family protein [Evansella tamaricis]MBU9714197.1 sulfurtransferase TusA family protein [Evansella tamaricis]